MSRKRALSRGGQDARVPWKSPNRLPLFSTPPQTHKNISSTYAVFKRMLATASTTGMKRPRRAKAGRSCFDAALMGCTLSSFCRSRRLAFSNAATSCFSSHCTGALQVQFQNVQKEKFPNREGAPIFFFCVCKMATKSVMPTFCKNQAERPPSVSKQPHWVRKLITDSMGYVNALGMLRHPTKQVTKRGQKWPGDCFANSELECPLRTPS